MKPPYIAVTKMLPVNDARYPFTESEQIVAEIPARQGRNGWFIDGPIPDVAEALSILVLVPEIDASTGREIDVLEGELAQGDKVVTLADLRQMESRGTLGKVCFRGRW